MAELRQVFERGGFRDVATYIQSGNVMFVSGAPRDSLESSIEAVLDKELGLSLMVVVRSLIQLRNVVRESPDAFGERPEEYHSDVVFLKAPLTPARVMSIVAPRPGVDRVWPGTGVVYFQRLSAKRSQSRLSRLVSTPEYAHMTIRSWRTTTKLLGLLDKE